jgi:hypothetical protein
MGVSSLAAYNGTGTQGTAVTNTIAAVDDGEVQSVFWNANDTTRVLLFGSSINEIPTSGGSGAAVNGNQIFTVNNDLDALGDLYLNLDVKIADDVTDEGGDVIDPALPCGVFSEDGLAALVKRVEFMVGTQVWQTLEGKDILSAQRTELSDGDYAQAVAQQRGNTIFSSDTRGNGTSLGPLNGLSGQIYPGMTYSCSLKLPLFSKTLGPKFTKFSQTSEDGYLMAAAPHQQVKIRVYYSDAKDCFALGTGHANEENRAYVGHSRFWSSAGNNRMLSTSTGLGADRGCVCYNSSNDQSVGKVYLYQISKPVPYGITIKTHLYGKQQVMCNAERQQLKNMPQGLPKRIKTTQNTLKTVTNPAQQFTVDLDHFSLYASYLVIDIQGLDVERPGGAHTFYRNHKKGSLLSAELLLNSTSISGVLSGEFLSASAANSLGINNSRTHFNGGLGDLSHFVFPLSSHAYDGSAIPLNRFDNIRLNLTCNTGAYDTTKGATVSVTCFGETTALYVKGSASLSMY